MRPLVSSMKIFATDLDENLLKEKSLGSETSDVSDGYTLIISSVHVCRDSMPMHYSQFLLHQLEQDTNNFQQIK